MREPRKGKVQIHLMTACTLDPLTPLTIDVLVRFLEHKIVLVGDIKKAFLKIKISPEDRDYLRFLWVRNILAAASEIEVFRFCRVIFGCGPSPFLLNGTLKHHLSKYEEDDPDFVQKMKNVLYVDYLASGGNTVKEAYNPYLKARARMMHGGFEMHKWKSNSSELTRLITAPNKCESEK